MRTTADIRQRLWFYRFTPLTNFLGSAGASAALPSIKCVRRKGTHSKLDKAPETKGASGLVCAVVSVHCHRAVHVKSASRARGIPESMAAKHGCNVVGDQD